MVVPALTALPEFAACLWFSAFTALTSLSGEGFMGARRFEKLNALGGIRPTVGREITPRQTAEIMSLRAIASGANC